jgi:hypothetical protein
MIPTLCRHARWAISLALLSCYSQAQPAFADGPSDNLPTNVRQIPPPGKPLPTEVETRLLQTVDALDGQVKLLVAEHPALHATQGDIVVFTRAIRLAIEHQLFYNERDIAKADRLLAEAERRLHLWRGGASRLEILGIGANGVHDQPRLIVAGFPSHIDGSIQPYGLVIPAGWNHNDPAPQRLDVWLHGRGENVGELQFLDDRMTRVGEYAPANTFVLHPYGRYSNAFKFAGETDVYEAIADVEKDFPVNASRIAIRGFSMGGAGCWQFAVHDPSRWFAANPGAGFCETRIFLRDFQREAFQPSPAQEKMLRWYDCPPWVDNLRNVQTIAYSGEVDNQKQAADIMEQAMKEVGLTLNYVIGPQMGHQIDAGSKATMDKQLADWAGEPAHGIQPVDFTTYTLRYSKCDWVHVEGLVEHWEKGRIVARQEGPQLLEATTTGITQVRFALPAGSFSDSSEVSIRLDNEVFKIKPASDGSLSFQVKRDDSGAWSEGGLSTDRLRKRPGLQGPIDDAFSGSFLFVLPSGKSSDPLIERWTNDEAEHAMQEWRRHFRGDIRKAMDFEVTDVMLAESHCIVFGTPESNQVLARMASQLPLQWGKKELSMAGTTYDASSHVVAMIYPNPHQPNRYVVVNSGFTFREYAYLNNARQIAMLPDWAVINVESGANSVFPGTISAAGFFNETWEIPQVSTASSN